MNPASATFRATLEDLNRPAFQILPPFDPTLERVCEPFPANAPKPTLQRIEQVVETVFALAPGELRNATHARRISYPRHVAMFIMDLFGYSRPSISRHWGASIAMPYRAIEHVNNMVECYPAEGRRISAIGQILRGELSTAAERERGKP